VLLKRDGWEVNAKGVYRLYQKESLTVQTKKRKGTAHARVPLAPAERSNQRWSMDFISDRLADCHWIIRVLTVVDQFTREFVLLAADRSMTAMNVRLRWIAQLGILCSKGNRVRSNRTRPKSFSQMGLVHPA
jgi:putative transposase